MKSILCLAPFLLLASCAGTRAPAGDEAVRGPDTSAADTPMRRGMEKSGPGMGNGMMDLGMNPMRGMPDSCHMGIMMMHGMMGQEIVALDGGGVAVLIGGKLYKYDKNLKLQQEAELKFNPMRMRETMLKMMQGCPMMEGMSPDASGGSQGGAGEEESSRLNDSEPGSEDHESHH